MKKYNVIKVKGKEFWWRIYGYRGGKKLETIFNPEKFPLLKGTIFDLGIWNYPPLEIIEMVKTDCIAYLNGRY